MKPEEYHKVLEALVVAHPVTMASIIQTYGPLPDGASDDQRARMARNMERMLEGHP